MNDVQVQPAVAVEIRDRSGLPLPRRPDAARGGNVLPAGTGEIPEQITAAQSQHQQIGPAVIVVVEKQRSGRRMRGEFERFAVGRVNQPTLVVAQQRIRAVAGGQIQVGPAVAIHVSHGLPDSQISGRMRLLQRVRRCRFVEQHRRCRRAGVADGEQQNQYAKRNDPAEAGSLQITAVHQTGLGPAAAARIKPGGGEP